MLKMQFIKKISVILLSTLVLSSVSSFTVSAHNLDYFGGVYTNSSTISNMKYKVESSAITTTLTSSVYYSAYAWDDISSTVGSIGIAISVPGMPSTGFFGVLGQAYYDGTLGETIPRDSNGNIVGANNNWTSVSIYMNTASNAFSGAEDATEAAKKTFMHEVGHTLKLCHPANNSSASGHYYSGYPRAIMNQGFPNNTNVASAITAHDQENLRAKWGV